MIIRNIIIISFIYNLLYSNCKESNIEFRVYNISIPQLSCIPNLGQYLFYIKGEFSQSPTITNIISFNLENSNTKVLCYPLGKTSVSEDQLQCIIDLLDYPINNEFLFLPINPPNNDGYIFPNWKETIGKSPGTSNKITENKIICVPKELNSYNITSITSQGCSNNKNIILIKGNWLDESKLIPEDFNIDIKLGKNIMAYCIYNNNNQIQCKLDGYGEIKFVEKYFKKGINVFKIEKFDSSINVNNCNLASFISINILLLFFILIFL